MTPAKLQALSDMHADMLDRAHGGGSPTPKVSADPAADLASLGAIL